MCDFNQGQTLQEALLRMHALDDQGLYWFEEPVVFDNYAQSAQLARELKTPVSIGENIYGARSFFDAVQAQAADVYMPDLMRIGGVTGWMRAAAIAGAAGTVSSLLKNFRELFSADACLPKYAINRAHFDFLVVRNNATLATTLHDTWLPD